MTKSFLTAVLVAAAAGMPAQQQPPPQHAQAVVQTGVQAVLVDVVVHDRKGEPVRDLMEADFHITEDGVPQKVASFTLVSEGTRPSTPPVAGPLPSTPAIGSAAPVNEGPIVTAFVFDRLTPESRKLATQ